MTVQCINRDLIRELTALAYPSSSALVCVKTLLLQELTEQCFEHDSCVGFEKPEFHSTIVLSADRAQFFS